MRQAPWPGLPRPPVCASSQEGHLRLGVPMWECVAAVELFQDMILSVYHNFLLLQKESGEEVEVEEFYVKYKNL